MEVISINQAVKKSKAYTDASISALPKGLIYKGSVSTVSDLPTAEASKIGWLYTTTINGHEHVCDGIQWVDLSSDIPAAGDVSPIMNGAASAGSATTYSRSDHVHPSDTNRVEVRALGNVWDGTGAIANYFKSVDMCYGNGKYVVIPESGQKTRCSSDGTTWTESFNVININYPKRICYGNGKYVIVGYNSAIAYSSDAMNWTTITAKISNQYINYYDVCYGDGKFVAVGKNESGSVWAAYSLDGVTWSPSLISSPGTYGHWCSVAYGNGKFVAIASSASANYAYAYSTDGVNWSEGSLLAKLDGYSQFIRFYNGQFIIVQGNYNFKKYAYGSDGLNWSVREFPDRVNPWTGLICGGGVYLAYINNRGYISYDLVTWTRINWTLSGNLGGGCYGDGKIIIEYGNGKTLISSGGIIQNNIDVSDKIGGFVAPYIPKGMEYKGSVESTASLPSASPSNNGWVYIVETNKHTYASDGARWIDLTNGLDNKIDKDSNSSSVFFGRDANGIYATY